MNELVIEAKIENVGAVLEFVEAHIKDCPAKAQAQIAVAVDEIFSNIARYAYDGTDGAATVRISVGEEITIEFEDCGAAYDPLAKDDPDTTLSAEERGIGGLGIHIVKNIMDSTQYRREGHKNILTLKKNLV